MPFKLQINTSLDAESHNSNEQKHGLEDINTDANANTNTNNSSTTAQIHGTTVSAYGLVPPVVGNIPKPSNKITPSEMGMLIDKLWERVILNENYKFYTHAPKSTATFAESNTL